MKKILEDKRPIESIYFENSGDGESNKVGVFGVTEIVAYPETGEMAHVPWIAVKIGDEVISRVAARHVSINYHKAAPDTKEEETHENN